MNVTGEDFWMAVLSAAFAVERKERREARAKDIVGEG
jgi:hypothetical protein